MRHWSGGSDACSVQAAAGTWLAACAEMITWFWSVIMKMAAREETKDEVAALVSGAVETASAEAWHSRVVRSARAGP